MEEGLNPEVISKVSLPDIVDPTSVGCPLSEINKKFTLSERNSHGAFEEHAVGSVYAGTNIILKMEEEVKPEAIREVWLPAFVASTSDAVDVNEIKKEVSLSDSTSPEQSVKFDVVNHEPTAIQWLGHQVKSEVPDLKCDIASGDYNINIKLEPLTSKELHINNEVEENLPDQTMKMSTKIKNFSCGLCSSKFEFKKYLQQHIKTHTGEKPFKCSVCDYRSMRKSDLQLHIRRHTGEKPHKCNLCDYRCIQKSSLLTHIKTHTGEKPYQCTVCDYKCIQSCDLQKHIKTHTGETMFKCCLCDYKCIRKDALQQHMRTHTGEKPFMCNVCDYRCTRKSSVQRHINGHTTGEKP